MGKYDHSVTFFSFARQRVTDHYLENSEEIEAPGHRTRGSRWSKRGLFCRFATGNSSIWLHWNPIAAQGTYYPTRGLSLRSVDSLAGACGLSGVVSKLQGRHGDSAAEPFSLSSSAACRTSVPRPGSRPTSPALQGGVPTPGPPGESLGTRFSRKSQKKKKRTCKNSDTMHRSKWSLFSMVTIRCLE